MEQGLMIKGLIAAARAFLEATNPPTVEGPKNREMKVTKPKENKKSKPVDEDEEEEIVEDEETDDSDEDESDLEEIDEDEEESGPTHEDLMLALRKYLKTFKDPKKGRIEAKKILKKFGSSKVIDIEKSKIKDVIKALKVK